jgi:hypothetical protein
MTDWDAGLALARCQSYLSRMALPRPASPSALIADLRAFFAERGRHRLIAAGLAVIVPGIIFTGFFLQDRIYKPPERTVTVSMWKADRTDEEIIADQKKAQAEKEERQKEKQRQFQNLANMLGIETE